MTISSNRILISGGTGLIGSSLIKLLISEGYELHILSRSNRKNKNALFFHLWNPDESNLPNDLKGNFKAIINLAGEGIAEKRWNKRRKEELLSSRINPLNSIFQLLNRDISADKIISTSASGYFGMDRGKELLFEDSVPGNDFISELCRKWESNVKKISKLVNNSVILRFGIVLTAKGGALPKIANPILYFAGTSLGSGNQYVSWIHIDDLCQLILWFIRNEKNQGTYNAVSPHPVQYKTLVKEIANMLNRPIWLPPVPKKLLNIVLGEVSKMLTGSLKVSSTKIQTRGFKFMYPDIKSALQEIYKKS